MRLPYLMNDIHHNGGDQPGAFFIVLEVSYTRIRPGRMLRVVAGLAGVFDDGKVSTGPVSGA